MPILNSRTLSVSIDRPPDQVHAFVSNPENLPQWATAFCLSVRPNDGDWVIETPDGSMRIRFVEKNPFGILDHYVTSAPGTNIHVPMRVVPNGSGSEVMLTLFQGLGMSDEKLAQDIRWVERDLQTLKRVLEN